MAEYTKKLYMQVMLNNGAAWIEPKEYLDYWKDLGYKPWSFEGGHYTSVAWY